MQRRKQTNAAKSGAASRPQADDDDGEEIRLVPKKKPQAAPTSQPGVTRIAPSAEQPKAAAPLIQEVSSTPAHPAAQPKKKQGGGGFGFKAGFLLGGNKKKAAPKAQPAAAAQPKPAVVEDVTHVKAKDPNANLRFDEVQNNLKTNLERTKDEWLTPNLLEKIMQSPRLSKAFSNP